MEQFMPVLVYILTGCLGIISILIGIIYGHLSGKDKENMERIEMAERRLSSELKGLREGTEKTVEKLETRHDRDLSALYERLGEQIRTSETNILAQIRLMVDTMRKMRD